MTITMKNLIAQLPALLRESNGLDLILREALVHYRAQTGTIHRFDSATQWLHLAAHTGVPPQLLAMVQTIPSGKGIAGQVVAQNRPVTLCNLQTDTSGVAKPGAKQTGVGGSLCVPIRRGGAIVGTFGVGTQREHEFSAAEINELLELTDALGKWWP
jgi:GAF domain-containing protein